MNENLSKMPVEGLMEYAEALERLCLFYEKQLIPMYGGPTSYSKDGQGQVQLQARLTKAKSYLRAVLDILERKVYDNIDNYVPEEPRKVPEKVTKPVIKKEGRPARKPGRPKKEKKEKDEADE